MLKILYVLHTNTSPKFYSVQLKSVFSISVENSVDPDKMASEQDLVFSKIESTGQGFILGSAGQG